MVPLNHFVLILLARMSSHELQSTLFFLRVSVHIFLDILTKNMT